VAGAAARADAQPAYVLQDLGRVVANDVVPSFPPRSVVVASNGTGQVGITETGPFPGGNSVFFWEPGLAAPLFTGSHRDDSMSLYGISSNGIIVGTDSGGVAAPYRWSRSEGFTVLSHTIDGYYPLAVNAAGVVVGTGPRSGGGFHAIVWYTPDKVTYVDDLTIDGGGPWQSFDSANAISDSGVITGIGHLNTSAGTIETHYFALTPTSGGGGGALDRSDWTASATEFSASDPPSNAIDGNLNTRFSTGQAQHDSQGFAVSWPGDRTISRIRFEVGPSTGDYPRICGIWTTDTNGNVTQLPCQADSSGNVDVSFTALAVHKIEVWQWGTSGSWWSIAEFNAFR
jgi:hypothetical protein